MRDDAKHGASNLATSVGAVPMSAENDHVGPNPVGERANGVSGIADREMNRNVSWLEAGSLQKTAHGAVVVAAR